MTSETTHAVPNLKPGTPPPAYSIYVSESEVIDENYHSPGSGSSSNPHSSSSAPPPPFESRLNRQHYPTLPPFGPEYGGFTPPLAFGPTPLGQTQPTLGLLPYHDPRSPYAIAAAASRARWRFVAAAVWAMGFLILVFVVAAWNGLKEG
ncbi:hypothetical protein BJ138DRAFT_594601 [Hygrophoropsis aurantiaca]|uniref:Uncharacterized protein n=1 Tax=Hygrophoropsis aurantiaca TaxID=72124 RepID=A0ACB8AV14_9AGAM|nr:hypothetical protein BJ138DRAFT_594601 [Hygrophoropsis aurantiaca]